MHLPAIEGTIRRRILANFRADPQVVAKLLPRGIRPKLHAGDAIVGVCLIRLEDIRPHHLPAALGVSSENAAHRFAIEWDDASGPREGVYVARRDTDSWLNQVAGGRIFPGEHHAAKFEVDDDGDAIRFEMRAEDESVRIALEGRAAVALPASSGFGSLAESSAFFAAGSLGYSRTRDAGRYDGLILETPSWHVRPFAIDSIESSYFASEAFPRGSIRFDHALVMRDIQHRWHQAPDFVELA
jgi:uncharacterized protein YqjF (DUF2071 family)